MLKANRRRVVALLLPMRCAALRLLICLGVLLRAVLWDVGFWRACTSVPAKQTAERRVQRAHDALHAAITRVGLRVLVSRIHDVFVCFVS